MIAKENSSVSLLLMNRGDYEKMFSRQSWTVTPPNLWEILVVPTVVEGIYTLQEVLPQQPFAAGPKAWEELLNSRICSAWYLCYFWHSDSRLLHWRCFAMRLSLVYQVVLAVAGIVGDTRWWPGHTPAPWQPQQYQQRLPMFSVLSYLCSAKKGRTTLKWVSSNEYTLL